MLRAVDAEKRCNANKIAIEAVILDPDEIRGIELTEVHLPE